MEQKKPITLRAGMQFISAHDLQMNDILEIDSDGFLSVRSANGDERIFTTEYALRSIETGEWVITTPYTPIFKEIDKQLDALSNVINEAKLITQAEMEWLKRTMVRIDASILALKQFNLVRTEPYTDYVWNPLAPIPDEGLVTFEIYRVNELMARYTGCSDDIAVYKYILQHQSQSVDWALKHGGWRVVMKEEATGKKVDYLTNQTIE